MSNRELCVKLLDSVPEYKMGYLLAYLQGLTAGESGEQAYCERLAADHENDPAASGQIYNRY